MPGHARGARPDGAGAVLRCANCGTTVSEWARRCPECGDELLDARRLPPPRIASPLRPRPGNGGHGRVCGHPSGSGPASSTAAPGWRWPPRSYALGGGTGCRSARRSRAKEPCCPDARSGPCDLPTDLEVRDIRVQVQPINALHLQRHMTVEHLVDVDNRRHHQSLPARGPALPARQPQLTRRSRGGRPGGGPAPLPLTTSSRKSLDGRRASLLSLVRSGRCGAVSRRFWVLPARLFGPSGPFSAPRESAAAGLTQPVVTSRAASSVGCSRRGELGFDGRPGLCCSWCR
ncbi:MAG: hypothetical protein QOG44_3517 [Acidimicrobiaceae bacterium]|nr:hypothetical protein [Acidimicrobiaceae bacterium]